MTPDEAVEAGVRAAGEEVRLRFSASQGRTFDDGPLHRYVVTERSVWRVATPRPVPTAPEVERWPLAEVIVDVTGRRTQLFTPEGWSALSVEPGVPVTSLTAVLREVRPGPVHEDAPRGPSSLAEALDADGRPWNPSVRFVRWQPRGTSPDPDATTAVLGIGHPGVVTDPSWQDVGVSWVGLEALQVSAGAVYDTRDLKQVDTVEFARAVLCHVSG